MLNVKPEIKTSHNLLMLISKIERLTGRREFHSQIIAGPNETELDSIQRNYLAALCLDQTTPAQLTHPILSFFKSSPDLSFNIGNIVSEDSLKQGQACKECFVQDLEFSENEITKLFLKLTQTNNESLDASEFFRKSIGSFLTHENQRVFTTVSPFLLKRRFHELVEWVSDELYCGETHPIIIAGTYHLLFLQLHPFASANHRIALLTTWHLLENSGYTFVKDSDFIGLLLRDEREYYTSLKQAEHSTFTDWTTMNAWLEFFTAHLLECATNCFKNDAQSATLSSLSPTQKKILEIIKREGAVSREKVVTETGISSSTVKYNLSQLAERGHLKRGKWESH